MNLFKYYILRKRYTISDLVNPKALLSEQDRHSVKVLIVDDEEFTYEDSLRRAGFNIQKYDDIESTEAVEAFHIVICDVRGVGKKFKSQQEGAFVLSRLKQKYPMKEFAVYSGSLFNTDLTETLQNIHIIKKDQPSEDWCNDIDTLIRKVSNPKIIWQKIARIMIENEVPTRVISKMEHEYVEVIRDKNGDFSNFPSPRCLKTLDGDICGIVHSLVAGIVLLPFSL